PAEGISVLFRGGHPNCGDEIPYLRSSLDALGANFVLSDRQGTCATLPGAYGPNPKNVPVETAFAHARAWRTHGCHGRAERHARQLFRRRRILATGARHRASL